MLSLCRPARPFPQQPPGSSFRLALDDVIISPPGVAAAAFDSFQQLQFSSRLVPAFNLDLATVSMQGVFAAP